MTLNGTKIGLAIKILTGLVLVSGILAGMLNLADERYVTRAEMRRETMEIRRMLACGFFQFPQGCEERLLNDLSGYGPR